MASAIILLKCLGEAAPITLDVTSVSVIKAAPFEMLSASLYISNIPSEVISLRKNQIDAFDGTTFGWSPASVNIECDLFNGCKCSLL